jgi:hypothetical protein
MELTDGLLGDVPMGNMLMFKDRNETRMITGQRHST